MKEGRAGRTTEDETQPANASVEAFLAAVEQQVRRDDALVLAGTIQTGLKRSAGTMKDRPASGASCQEYPE